MVTVLEPKEYPSWVEKLNIAYEILAQNFIDSCNKYCQAFALINGIGYNYVFDGWPKYEKLNENIEHFVDLVVTKFTRDLEQKGVRLDLKAKEVIPKELIPKLDYDRSNNHPWIGDPLAFKPSVIYEYLFEQYAGNVATDEAAKQAATLIGDKFGGHTWKFYTESNSSWGRLPELHEGGNIANPILPIIQRWAAGAKTGKGQRIFSFRCGEQSVVINPIPNKVQWSHDTSCDIRKLALALQSFASLTKEESALPSERIDAFINRFAATGLVNGTSLNFREKFECGEITFVAFKSKMEIRVSERLFGVLRDFIRDNHPACKGA